MEGGQSIFFIDPMPICERRIRGYLPYLIDGKLDIVRDYTLRSFANLLDDVLYGHVDLPFGVCEGCLRQPA